MKLKHIREGILLAGNCIERPIKAEADIKVGIKDLTNRPLVVIAGWDKNLLSNDLLSLGLAHGELPGLMGLKFSPEEGVIESPTMTDLLEHLASPAHMPRFDLWAHRSGKWGWGGDFEYLCDGEWRPLDDVFYVWELMYANRLERDMEAAEEQMKGETV